MRSFPVLQVPPLRFLFSIWRWGRGGESSCSLTSAAALTLPGLSRWFCFEDDVSGVGSRAAPWHSPGVWVLLQTGNRLFRWVNTLLLLGHFFLFFFFFYAAGGTRKPPLTVTVWDERARVSLVSVWRRASNCAIRALTCSCDPWSFESRQWAQFPWGAQRDVHGSSPIPGSTPPLHC